MSKNLFYGDGLPYLDVGEMPGKLIVVEGTDSVGRSTQIELIKSWLEVQRLAVATTDWTQSVLVGDGIERAKRGNTLDPMTLALFYASDLADRLESQIIPALKAGFIVLADRYMYTAFARNAVRGVDANWMRGLFGFALNPDLVLYMKSDTKTLLSNALHSEKGIDYWEAGMDLHLSNSVYDSFIEYQSRLMTEYDKMKDEFNFVEVNTSDKSIDEVCSDLQTEVRNFLDRN